MPVKIYNLTGTLITLPDPVDSSIPAHSSRDFLVEYDSLINDDRFIRILVSKKIRIENLDEGGQFVSQWNMEPKLRLLPYVFWVDALGQLRMKNGDPTGDLDGVIIGPGGGLVPHGSTHEFTGTDPVPNIEVLENLWNCPTSVAVRDAVYQSSTDTVSRALANTNATMPVVGVVIAKPTATTCIISRSGEVSGFSLTADRLYYASAVTAGAITTSPPSGAGRIVQKVGYSKSTSVLTVELGETRRRA